MLFWTFLLLLLLALLIASIAGWPYSRRWGIRRPRPCCSCCYVGYIGPWEQAGPPFHVEGKGDPEVDADTAVDADSVDADGAGAD
jgi:hypothetical protein